MGTALRLELACEAGLDLPSDGNLGVFGARAGLDLSGLPHDRLQVEARHFPDHAAFDAAGLAVTTYLDTPVAAAIVIVPRAKAEAQALLARAARLTRGPLIVDGQKTDGVDGVLKALKSRATAVGSLSKAHGKLAWFDPPFTLQDWESDAGMREIQEGFHTAPGVFSADAPDPGSVLLAQCLPEKPGARVADLGAGWGYLARHVLTRPKVQSLDLVEADAVALDCARLNVADDRARFNWADATTWGASDSLDCVVMNPPFHTGRRADPDLGRAFVTNASRILRRAGVLWMVANRHLPYEATLDTCFAQVEIHRLAKGFKVIRASRPRR